MISVAPLQSGTHSSWLPWRPALRWDSRRQSQPKPPQAAMAAEHTQTRCRLKTVREATTCLINKRRAKRGISTVGGAVPAPRGRGRPLRSDGRGALLLRTPTPTGLPRRISIRATGYLKGSNNWATGENIGWGADWRAEPKEMVRAWMNSPSHRASILSRNFRHIGVGIVRGAPRSGVSGAATYTTDFGRN